jgi:hypothetical protein
MAKKGTDPKPKTCRCEDCIHSSNPHDFMVFCEVIGFCRAIGIRAYCVHYKAKQ